MGTAMTAPRRFLASSSLMTRRMIWIPLSSSPWIAADNQILGPADRPLITFTGSDSVAPVTTLANGSSIWTFRPGLTVTWPTVMGSFTLLSGANVVFDVLDDQVCDVDATDGLDAFETG